MYFKGLVLFNRNIMKVYVLSLLMTYYNILSFCFAGSYVVVGSGFPNIYPSLTKLPVFQVQNYTIVWPKSKDADGVTMR